MKNNYFPVLRNYSDVLAIETEENKVTVSGRGRNEVPIIRDRFLPIVRLKQFLEVGRNVQFNSVPL
jgi:hypothetical protein